MSRYETTPHRLGAAPFPNDRVSRSSSSRGTPPIVAPRLPGHTMQRPEAHCSIAAVASRSPAAKAAIPCQRKLIKSAGALSAARPFQQPEAVALPLGNGGSPPDSTHGTKRVQRLCLDERKLRKTQATYGARVLGAQALSRGRGWDPFCCSSRS